MTNALMLAWDMMVGLGGLKITQRLFSKSKSLKISHLSKIRLFLEDGAETASFACVGAAMANETWNFVQAKSKQAMKQVAGTCTWDYWDWDQRREGTHDGDAAAGDGTRYAGG